MTEELAQLAEIINSLGDKGILALIVWVIADLLNTLMVWGFSAWALISIGKRIRDSIIYAKEEE